MSRLFKGRCPFDIHRSKKRRSLGRRLSALAVGPFQKSKGAGYGPLKFNPMFLNFIA